MANPLVNGISTPRDEHEKLRDFYDKKYRSCGAIVIISAMIIFAIGISVSMYALAHKYDMLAFSKMFGAISSPLAAIGTVYSVRCNIFSKLTSFYNMILGLDVYDLDPKKKDEIYEIIKLQTLRQVSTKKAIQHVEGIIEHIGNKVFSEKQLTTTPSIIG